MHAYISCNNHSSELASILFGNLNAAGPGRRGTGGACTGVCKGLENCPPPTLEQIPGGAVIIFGTEIILKKPFMLDVKRVLLRYLFTF